jgi:NAD(P)-dependent dehydrogenase (short-subunit alcohol dehydrogenase family)
LKTLILGGYGNFGARIARALASERDIRLLIGGRDADRAQRFAAGLDARGVAVDASDPDLESALRRLEIDLVIHTAGPFQHQRPDVALAAARAGAHYIDLADGRRFVCDFTAHTNDAFQSAKRCAFVGASTVPTLSSAVVDHLSSGWQRIESIDCCIAPAQTAPRGVATMAAVLSYCGEPISVWTDGRWQPRSGWSRPSPVQFARMRSRLGALCDIPDLELFPSRYRGTRSVMFRAALEVSAAQRAMAALAALRAAGLIPSPARWARTMNALAKVFDRWGSATGGMCVGITGVDAHGRDAARTWHITADNGHGPEIPCMPAILLARRLASGSSASEHGAQVCIGTLSFQAFAPEFARWGMQTDIVVESGHGMPATG